MRKDCTGYADISDISFNNFDIETDNGFAIYLKCIEGIDIRGISKLTFNNFRIKSRFPILIEGHANSVISDIILNNITGSVDGETPFITRYVRNLKMNNVDLTGAVGEAKPPVKPTGTSWETQF